MSFADSYRWEISNIVLSFIVAAFTLGELSRYHAESLTPWTMLFTHIFKMASTLAILALDAVIFSQGREMRYTTIGLPLASILLYVITQFGDRRLIVRLTTSIIAIYALMTYRRTSEGDTYVHPSNIKPFGYANSLDQSRRPSVQINKHFSVLSARLSTSSIREDPEALQNTLEKTSSVYSHERDTQYDAFIARRASVDLQSELAASQGNSFAARRRSSSAGSQYLRPHTDGGISPETSEADFTNPFPEAGGSTWTRPPLGRTNNEWGATVTDSRRLSAQRQLSWTSDHVLVAVPEEVALDEEKDRLDDGRGEVSEEEDSESLLGKRKRQRDSVRRFARDS